MLKWSSYGCAVDVFSVALCAVEILTSKPLLPGESEVDQVEITRKILGGPDHDAARAAPRGHRGSGAWSGDHIHRPSTERRNQLFNILSKGKKSPFLECVDNGAKRNSSTPQEYKPLTIIQMSLLVDELVDLLSKMVSWNPCKRPTANDALFHPFFTLAKQQGLI